MKVWRDDRLAGTISMNDLIELLRREGITVPPGSSFRAYVSGDRRDGVEQRIDVGWGVHFEILSKDALVLDSDGKAKQG